MHHNFNFQDVLAISSRPGWAIEDVLPPGARLDYAVHWMEEAQHAKLDTLMVEALAEGRDEAGIQRVIDEYLEIGTFLDDGLKQQAAFNLDAFERATGRRLDDAEREELQSQQHQGFRWTYLGSGMTHPNFVASLEAMSLPARDRIAEIAPVFC